MHSIIVVGMQWGDEGKGKVIDLLSESAAHIVRSQGGNNAGHTIMVGGQEYRFHLIPSGILYPHTHCYVAGGTAIDPQVILEEIEGLKKRGISLEGRLFISPYAHINFSYHRLFDELYELQKGPAAIGTTKRGIGPCYTDRANRSGIRMCELMRPDVLRKRLTAILAQKNIELQNVFQRPPIELEPLYNEALAAAERLRPYVGDVEKLIGEALARKENVLFEGAHGTFLDLIFGTYPYVTSSNTIAAGICAGAGVGPTRIDHTIGVIKSYTTRVGAGPLPTALAPDEVGLFPDHMTAREIGSTTGRKRRMGWFDSVLGRFAARLSGVDSIALTKLDILDALKEIKICTAYRIRGEIVDSFPPLIEDLEQVEPIYETLPGWQTSTKDVERYADLPVNARRYIERIQELCGVPMSLLSLGPDRERTLILHKFFKEPILSQ